MNRSSKALLVMAALGAVGLSGSVASAQTKPADRGAQPGGRFDYEVTVYALPSPRPTELSWASPGKLIRRTIVNSVGSMVDVYSRSIGHMGVRVQCAPFAGKPAGHFQGSMANKDNGEQFNDLVIKQKVGLGMLFYNVDGVMEKENELQVSLDERYKNGRVAYARFGVSGDTCHALLDYVKAYDREKVWKNYGLKARPLFKEGAGCSAFSMSFLKLANIMDRRFVDNWSFYVKAPKKLVGGKLNPGNTVPLPKLLVTGVSWADPGEPGFSVFGWDPTMAFHWIKDTAERAKKKGGEIVEQRGKAWGLVFDRRNVQPLPQLKNRTFWGVEWTNPAK